MTLELRYAVRSDVGLLREGNEDSAYAGPRLLAVADGMGGHAAGEVASALTIASMAELDSEQSGGDMLKALAMAVATANARLQEKIIANPAVEGMGTTLTALLWSNGHAGVCHIGDSRGYLLREGELYQITHDHTLVQSLVDEGRISADDVSTHPQRSLLLRALDGRSVAEPDLSVHESMPGDRYLLCSDGLSGVVSDETLRDTLSSHRGPRGRHPPADRARDPRRRPGQHHLHRGGRGGRGHDAVAADHHPGAGRSRGDAGRPPAGRRLRPVRRLRGSPENHVRAARTAPQPAVDDLDPLEPDPLDPMMTSAVVPLTVSENGADPRGTHARRSHRAQPRRSRGSSGRRRWPIVTTALAVLLAVVIGGGYIFWRVSQTQYYVAANSNGAVVIYRGINYRIPGSACTACTSRLGFSCTRCPGDVPADDHQPGGYGQPVPGSDDGGQPPDGRR